MSQLTFGLPAPHASPSALQESERDWMTLVATSLWNSFGLLALHGPAGWYGRTSPESSRSMTASRLEASSGHWGNSGMGSPTECLTRSTSEFPSGAVACSLSDILETGDLPRRYFLSATACRGILRRAERRGKELPTSLHRALQRMEGATT